MNYTIKENTKKDATLEIKVSKEEFEAGLQKSYIKNKKHFSIPGFRKGKVPRKMVEKYYGESILYEDAVNFIIPDKYQEALDDSKLEVVSRPEVDITSISSEEGFTFTAKVYLKPEVILSGYKGIKAKKAEYNVTDSDIEREINALKEKTARIVEVTGRAVENEDIVNINYEGFCDGVAFPGGKAENYDLMIGSGQFIPGFEEQIIGKNINDEFDINVTFPKEYHAEDLKGKDAVFKVKINKISKKEYSELNDEFAKDVSEFETFKELKDDITKNLEDNAKQRSKVEFENNVLEEVLKIAQIDIPDCMIEDGIDRLADDFEYRLKSQGLSKEKYLEYTGMTEEAYREQFKERAEKQVKTGLALAKISEIENIEVTDEEIDAEINKMAESYKTEAEKIKKFINTEELKEELKAQKAVDFLVENAVAVDEPEEKKEKEQEKKTTKKTTAKKTTTTKKTVKKSTEEE